MRVLDSPFLRAPSRFTFYVSQLTPPRKHQKNTVTEANNGEYAPDLSEEQMLARLQEGKEKIMGQLRRRIIGQEEVIEQVLVCLFAGGHCLITGVPGLAKTLLIKSLGEILDLTYKRIQFTPDLMPADITGIDVLEEDRTTAVIPPMVARDAVDTSTGNHRPCGFKARLSWSSTIPGSTVQR